MPLRDPPTRATRQTGTLETVRRCAQCGEAFTVVNTDDRSERVCPRCGSAKGSTVYKPPTGGKAKAQ